MNADEYSIFSTILADVGAENPTILQNKKNLSDEYSVFSTILADVDDENPTILQNKKKLSDESSSFSTVLADTDEENPMILQKEQEKKSPIDFTCTVPQTLTHSDLVHLLNHELAILKSEMEIIKGQANDRSVSPNPNYGRESVCVEEEGKVEQHCLADVVVVSKGDEISTDPVEDSVCEPKPEDDGEILNTFDEGIDIEEILEKIKKDGSYLERVKEDFMFGGLPEERLVKILKEKAEKEEKEISSWISNGEEPEETETEVEEGEKEERRDNEKKKSPVKRTEQESTVTKQDFSGYKRRLYLIEKLRERDENLMKRRMKAVRFGVEFSFLVAEYTFLTPNELLASETENYWICLKRLGVNEDDKGTSVIIRKLKEVFEIVMRKKEENKHNMKNLPESIFRFEDYSLLCADAIRVLGKIVWGLRKSKGGDEKVKLSDLDSWFEDFGKVLMKIELKLAEMKQCVYRLVSADYESFSKSERFDSLLKGKVMKRVNADNGFGRSVVGSDLVEIWKSLFQANELQEKQRQQE